MFELFFVFFQWGTQRKQEIIHGVKLNFKSNKEDGKVFNIIYNLERGEIFWIPLGGWNIEEVFVQSVKSGKIYSLKEDLTQQAKELYWKAIEEEKDKIISKRKIIKQPENIAF